MSDSRLFHLLHRAASTVGGNFGGHRPELHLEPHVADSGPMAGSYWDRERTDIISAAARSGFSGKILDVGCGAGWVGSTMLRTGLATEVVGIEMNESVVERATERLTSVIFGDANEYLTGMHASFDGAVLADVLEHQIDPDYLLRQVVDRVRPGGRVVISLPNIRHFRIVLNLTFRGEWTYVDEGILDRTHLRFFTLKSALEMVRRAGLEPEFVLGIMTERGRAVSRVVAFLSPLLSTQIVLGCRTQS